MMVCIVFLHTRIHVLFALLYQLYFIRKNIQILHGKSNPNIRISDFVLQSSVMKPQKTSYGIILA